MIKKIIIFSALLFVPFFVSAQTFDNTKLSNDQIFRAKVLKILDEKTITREDGSKAVQQNLLLRGLEKEWKNKEIEHRGISEIDMASASNYKVGDKVMVSEVKSIDGATDYFVTDFVRSGYLYWLAFIFAAIIVAIGRMKGVKSLLLLILAIIIYITDGWSKKSHISVASVFFSLLATFILSWVFTHLTRLTGMGEEESIFLLGVNNGAIDFRGLLLTGILIGTVGVLDDVIVSQVELVRQIRMANPNLTDKQVYKSAFEVGNTHLGAIVNTLFLTYAGASLPLLLLFYVNPIGNTDFSQVINNELIATEIVRTLVGSIGVALSIPISTFLATVWLKEKKLL